MSNKKRRNKKEDEASAANSAVPSIVPLVDPTKYTELLRLWREKEGSGLYVETSGHLLASSEPLNDRQRKRFVDLIKELADWLNIEPGTISEKIADPSPVEVAGIVTPPIAQQTVFVESPAPLPPQNVGEPIIQAPVPPPSIPYSPPPPPPKPIVKPAADQVKKPAQTMVQQIDEILQDFVLNSDKPDRIIRLVEEPREGVIVWVDHDHYIGIDAVPDTSVTDLIRAAVKEWDRRTEIHL